jgi:hypothetical protein
MLQLKLSQVRAEILRAVRADTVSTTNRSGAEPGVGLIVLTVGIANSAVSVASASRSDTRLA